MSQEKDIGECKLPEKVGSLKTGAELARLCVDLYADEELEVVFAAIVEAVQEGLDLRAVVLDGTLAQGVGGILAVKSFVEFARR